MGKILQTIQGELSPRFLTILKLNNPTTYSSKFYIFKNKMEQDK
ncbi:MAG TPA: hypothetical protein VI230_08295 [Ignavibacteriaceae bacterium]